MMAEPFGVLVPAKYRVGQRVILQKGRSKAWEIVRINRTGHIAFYWLTDGARTRTCAEDQISGEAPDA